jgi:hypothetical protein
MIDIFGGEWLYTPPPETGEVIIGEHSDGSGIFYCRFGEHITKNGSGNDWFQLDWAGTTEVPIKWMHIPDCLKLRKKYRG